MNTPRHKVESVLQANFFFFYRD